MMPNHGRFYWRQMPGARRVLDLGCAGGDLARLKPDGTTVFGIDANVRLLQRAKSHEIVQAWDLDRTPRLPFPDAYFDWVVAKDILEHLRQPWKTLEEVHRVLRPGGGVLASVITPRSRHVWNDYTHIRGFTRSAVRQMFDDAGFAVEAIWRMGPVPLAARLNVIHLVPQLLRLPPFDWLWTSSWEVRGTRRD
jgi:SAM-dependent methyltransferase